ncbi:hypothetical protein FACS189444_0390 [Spirochaetia bacterium]|nr:hypothetical protein FACS189444_0390 [Spirochaetia bacterium]
MKFLTRAVLAAISVFMILGCAPEVTLTDPDWGTYNERFAVAGPAAITEANTIPSIYATSSLVQGSANPANFEVTINFGSVENADVLQKKSLADIEKGLQEFLTFNTVTANVGTAASTFTPIAYTVKSRVGTTITVTLSSLSTSPVVPVIKGSAYKIGGNTIDVDRDGTAGDATYDNVYYGANTSKSAGYEVLSVSNPTSTISGWEAPVSKGWSVGGNVGGTDFGPTATERTAYVGLNAGSLPTADRNTVLTSKASKFILEKAKIDSPNSWTAVSGSFAYSSTSNMLELKYTPEDLTLYRIRAAGINKLTTDAPYYGVNQRITIGSGKLTDNEVVVDGPAYAYNNTTHTNSGADITEVKEIGKAADGTGVELRVIFDEDLATLPALDVFKKNFKIAYSASDDSIDNANLGGNGWEDIVFISITAAKLASTSTNATPNTRAIDITLDPAYKHDSSKAKYFLIAPGIKTIAPTFNELGNYGNWRYESDGVRHFEVYTPPATTF